MSPLRTLITIFLFALCVANSALAQIPVPLNRDEETARPAQIRELVSQYCRLDYQGDRLTPQGWTKLQPAVWWKDNPEFSRIHVISRFTVDTDPVLSRGKYTVAVHYRLLGSYDLAAGYMPEPPNSVQDVSYTVSSVNGEWRITDTSNMSPHVSSMAMLAWLKGRISATQDPAARRPYENAMQQLQPPAQSQ